MFERANIIDEAQTQIEHLRNLTDSEDQMQSKSCTRNTSAKKIKGFVSKEYSLITQPSTVSPVIARKLGAVEILSDTFILGPVYQVIS